MRPGEPTRSTLGRWLQTCRRCCCSAPDLAAVDVSALTEEAKAALIGSMDRAEAAFFRWARLCEAIGDTRNQAEALLQGAWDAEDRRDDAEAARLRQAAAALWDDTPDNETALRRLDVLRRAGAWAEARAWAARLEGREWDEISASILRFQRRRIEMEDSGRHLISAALPPPVTTPHVTHVRQRRPGLFSRLFGRE